MHGLYALEISNIRFRYEIATKTYSRSRTLDNPSRSAAEPPSEGIPRPAFSPLLGIDFEMSIHDVGDSMSQNWWTTSLKRSRFAAGCLRLEAIHARCTRMKGLSFDT